MSNTRSTIFFVSVVISLIFSWYFILPALQGIDLAKKAIELEKGDLELLEETQEQAQEAVSFFFSLSAEEKELMELAAPSYPDKVNAVIILDKLARDNGLTVSGIEITEGTAPKSGEQVLGTMPVSLNLTGSYPSLKAFIVRAEKTLRIFDIQTIDITAPSAESENPNILTVKITGNVYFTSTGN